jgi:hypothetical protein
MPGDYHFLEQDVCEEGFNLGEKFDVVLLLDVAFHVIDDLAFERLLANVSRHAQGVVFVTGLFRDQRMAAHVLHRRLEHFQSLGIVTSIYPWRDILLARIIHQPKKSTREGTFGGQDACQNNPSQEPRGPQTSSSDGQGAGQIGLIVTIGPNAPAQPSRG